MADIQLKNGYIMVKDVERADGEKLASGIIIEKTAFEDEQMSQGKVIRSGDENYKKGEVVMYSKTLPINFHFKIDDDTKPEDYFFIRDKDIICKVIE